MRGTAKGHRLFLAKRRKKKQWTAFYELFAPISEGESFDEALKEAFKGIQSMFDNPPLYYGQDSEKLTKQ